MEQQIKPIKWTPKQLKIYKAIMDSPGIKCADVASKLKVSKGLVSQVFNAIKAGQKPDPKKKNKSKAKTTHKQPKPQTQVASSEKLPQIHSFNPTAINKAVSDYAAHAQKPEQQPEEETELEVQNYDENTEQFEDNSEQGAEQEAEQVAEEQVPEEVPKIKTEKGPAVKPKSAAAATQELASYVKLLSVPVTCALTPMILNARHITIHELGWRDDMPWENWFDTCLYHLFKSWGYVLQGWYKVEEGEDGQLSPSETEGEAKGNGGGLGITKDDIQNLKDLIGLAKEFKQ